MNVERFELLGGKTGQDFVIYGRDGLERFVSRLFDGEKTLKVGWTDDIPHTVLWIREVQMLAGGPDSFSRITGIASDVLEAAIRRGTFSQAKASELLTRALGSTWRVDVAEQSDQPDVFHVIAEQTSGDRE